MLTKKLLLKSKKDGDENPEEERDIDKLEFGDWVFSIDKHVVKQVGSTLLLSNDGGVTYIKSVDYGSRITKLRFIYVFENGNLMIGDHKLLWYSHDWVTFTQTEITDIDGNTFVPTLRTDNYTVWAHDGFYQYINGQNVLLWSNYNFQENPNGATTAMRYAYNWFTDDYGKTVKCVFQYNVSIPNGWTSPLRARHGHGIYQHPDRSYFIGTCGDEPTDTDSSWLRITPKPGGGFDFDVIGLGAVYKTNMIRFVGDSIYYSIDKTPGGVGVVKEAEMADVSKHRVLLSISNDTCGISMNNKGEIVTTHSKWVGTLPTNLIHYSNDFGLSWHALLIPPPLGSTNGNGVYARGCQPNILGKVLMGSSPNYASTFEINEFKPSIWIDNYIRDAGFPNAFK